MIRFLQGFRGLLASALLLTPVLSAIAQEEKSAKPETFRAPVRGVMQKAVPEREVDESFSRHDVVELLAVDPEFSWAKNATFRRDIFHLKFECKPLRIVWVDLPQKSGKLQRKPVYYLVYSVTNVPIADQKTDPPRYGWMHPVQSEDEPHKFLVQYEDRPIRFVPEFLLESPEYQKAYSERYIPLALEAIRQREDRLPPGWSNTDKTVHREPLRSSVEMAGDIPVGKTLWGVAMWEEVDPRIDRFAIYVQGLTNAYQWKNLPERYRPGVDRSAYRKMLLKTLRLNFWRPGDEFQPEESEIRRGYPGKPDYEWLYLPNLSAAS
ncbi:MAG: hypothetical protein GX621_00945 [Pirellulaceae bacterium]|nr:hypothetical protein [Pirellulaceae bacterium]